MSEQRIVPHLWFDKQAVEAAEYYTSAFEGSEILHRSRIHDTPSGDCDIVGFRVMGYDFMAISAGPLFKINPSISFHVKCPSVEEVDAVWVKLSVGGSVLMELGEYPFSKRYGWIQDRYGVSWQVILALGDIHERITPVLTFTEKVCGKAEEAIGLYTSVFPRSESQIMARYAKQERPDREGSVKYARFVLDRQEFGAMDSARTHGFGFNEAVSLMVKCSDQEEIGHYWDKLSAVPEAEQCGWIKDPYGVSWQIVPANMGELLSRNPRKTTAAMLQMKKLIIAELKRAGEEG